jgi:hypothetical protein
MDWLSLINQFEEKRFRVEVGNDPIVDKETYLVSLARAIESADDLMKFKEDESFYIRYNISTHLFLNGIEVANLSYFNGFPLMEFYKASPQTVTSIVDLVKNDAHRFILGEQSTPVEFHNRIDNSSRKICDNPLKEFMFEIIDVLKELYSFLEEISHIMDTDYVFDSPLLYNSKTPTEFQIQSSTLLGENYNLRIVFPKDRDKNFMIIENAAEYFIRVAKEIL